MLLPFLSGTVTRVFTMSAGLKRIIASTVSTVLAIALTGCVGNFGLNPVASESPASAATASALPVIDANLSKDLLKFYKQILKCLLL